jgi:hypothetical protein
MSVGSSELLEFILHSVYVVLHDPHTGDRGQPCVERRVGSTLPGRDA